MRKKNLEIELQRLQGFTHPKASLEQYVTPANVASEILFFAYQMGDVQGRLVAELGSGPGIFTVGACYLKASRVFAVEVDGDAISDLKENLKRSGCENVEIILENVENVHLSVHTVFQNPPFGSQVRHSDMPFLKKALEIGEVVYTLHNSETREFLIDRIRYMGGNITHVREFEFYIPRIYEFHRRERVRRRFVFFRVEKGKDSLK